MSDVDLMLLTGFLGAGLRLGMAIGFAAIGEAVAERGGVINVGIEGIMLVGAFLATIGAVYSGSPWTGVALALVGGAAMAGIHAVLVILWQVDQIVSGIGLVVFGSGLSSFLFRLTLGGTPIAVPAMQPIELGALSKLPVIGPLLFGQNPLVYIGVIGAFGIGFMLNRTALGLEIRGCGENPDAATAMGIPVSVRRIQCIIFGGALAGLGGAYLAIAQINAFVENMVAGRGFLAIACVVFGRWRPLGALVAAISFGLAEAAQIRLQTRFPGLPYQFLVMLPNIVATIALVMLSRSNASPAALGR
jgi:ABC-type uncharacterized transport system permease subunit